MAIYKLEEICDIKRGSSPRPIKKWLTNSSGLMWAKISDINDNKIMNTKEWVDLSWKNNALLGSYKDLFITNSATPGVAFIQKNKNFIAYHDGFLKIVPNEKFILKKYLLYKLINDRYKLIKMGNGAIFINLSSKILKNWQIKLISLKTQKQIIDIIEPFEKLKNKYKLIKKKIKNLLINEYNKKENKYINLSEIIIKKTQKRSKQNLYFQTNGILELNIDFSKMINLNKINKIPSRANLVPKDNSILFSKLLGENKILPWFYEKENEYVFSTGFYNIQSKNLDHILSFLLTNDFKRKKTMFANGTTMIGINDNSIKNIKIKKSYENSNVFSKFIFKLIFIESKINKIKNKILKLLIE